MAAWLSLVFLSLPASPGSAEQRILALAPHIVETLYAVGAGPDIVGTVSFADYPEQAKALPKVGNYRKITVEAAIRLRPTLAIAMDNDVVGLRKLRDLGIRVEVSHPATAEGVADDIVRLGRMVGHGEEALRVADSIRARLEILRSKRREPAPRVFYEIWHEPLLTAGGDGFVSDALIEIGARNIFKSLSTDSPRVSIEAVLRAKPDVLIIPDEARDVDERAQFWRKLMQDPNVIVVGADHDLLHRPGPRLIDGMERLQRNLHTALGVAPAMQ
ncbi:MAG: ABC transporter substrate-binding protein [bacterium]|nr:ABC transporter substrate-binding protein [bacterium]MCP5065719.1 ABC transporter substrate-binding protein [bacterium]